MASDTRGDNGRAIQLHSLFPASHGAGKRSEGGVSPKGIGMEFVS